MAAAAALVLGIVGGSALRSEYASDARGYVDGWAGGRVAADAAQLCSPLCLLASSAL